MSGSFEDETGELNVPPTLISFAVAVGKAARAVSPEFKGRRTASSASPPPSTARTTAPSPAAARRVAPSRRSPLPATPWPSPRPATAGAESLFKMCVGNQIGRACRGRRRSRLFTPLYGSFIVELAEDAELPEVADGVVVEPLGPPSRTTSSTPAPRSLSLPSCRRPGERLDRSSLPQRRRDRRGRGHRLPRHGHQRAAPAVKIARPRVSSPSSPATNCEYDSARAFRAAGAEADTFVINNLTPDAVAESTTRFEGRHRKARSS